MALTAKTVPSVNSTGAPYVAGNFAPLRSEVTAIDLEVIGRIPEELTGRFLRIGPNPIDELDLVRLVRHHWFAGSGMAHGLRLRDGKAEWFRSRFVLDANAAKVLSRKPIPGPGEGTRDGNVNTSLMNVGGKLCAVVEAGSIPVELDYELASVRRTDFDGTLEAGFTGHPHFDPITREHHALAYEPFQPVRYISVDSDGRATTKARIDLPHIPLIHDMAFTQNFIIVPDFPVTFQPEHSHTDFPWLWDERRPSRIGLLPRSGDVSAIQWFEAPRCFAFHFANAYDDGDLTIIDLAKHKRMFLTDQNGPNEGAPIMVRWTLHRPSGRLTETVIDDRGNEFPRINGRRSGQAYRYIYTAYWDDAVVFGPAMKHDLERGTTEVHDYGPGRMTAEPVFVRKPGAVAEDEGWILSYVYDPKRDLSDVVILDAQDFAGEPIATIRLPVRVPFGFHGGWAPDVNASSPDPQERLSANQATREEVQMVNDLFNATRRDVILGAGAVAILAATTGAYAIRQEIQMATFTTRDDVTIYYKDWGPRDGEVVILSHGWPLNADSWESQAFHLASNGYRVITHDRRGHGRSSQPWDGNDMDHYADDLAQLIERLESAQRLAVRLLDRRRRSGALCRPPRHGPRRPHRAHLRRAADHAAH